MAVYKLGPASHTICRYEFLGEDYSVIAKFYDLGNLRQHKFEFCLGDTRGNLLARSKLILVRLLHLFIKQL